SLSGISNVRRYQPTLVSGYFLPSGLYPCLCRLLSLTKGNSTAQSCGRSSARHFESSNFAVENLKSPDFEKSLWSAPKSRSRPGSSPLPKVNFHPKSISRRSRGATADIASADAACG